MPHRWKSRVETHILMCPCLAEVHARMHGIRNFIQGGGGGGGGGGQVRRLENSMDTFFFFFYYSPEVILQLTEGVQWFYYRENFTFLRIQRGSRIFQEEGVLLFPYVNF